MSFKKDYSNGNAKVSVTFNPEFQEYRARLYICGSAYPSADYFTDCKTDACDTAQTMAAANSAVQSTAALRQHAHDVALYLTEPDL